MSRLVEFTTEQWAKRPRSLRRRRVKHEGCIGGSCGHVFKCRASAGQKPRFACGRYFGACMGGSQDNRCNDCWVKRERHYRRLGK